MSKLNTFAIDLGNGFVKAKSEKDWLSPLVLSLEKRI